MKIQSTCWKNFHSGSITFIHKLKHFPKANAVKMQGSEHYYYYFSWLCCCILSSTNSNCFGMVLNWLIAKPFKLKWDSE